MMPQCLNSNTPPPTNVKWRILGDDGWYHIECKTGDGCWEGGLSGSREWLGLTDEECAGAYPFPESRKRAAS